ncbi:MAG: GCD complex subunit gcd7 [Chrysothrix sp. TS-e1954]|nr:MAG: GCD complex subunit gcd7 [Chrysothrix sp. TS-e1954]
MPANTTAVSQDLFHYLKRCDAVPVQTSIDSFVTLLKQRRIQGARSCAIATVKLLQRVVTTLDFSTTEELLNRIKDVGKYLIAAQTKEAVVGNIVRRALGLIREVTEPLHEDFNGSGSNVSKASEKELQAPSEQRNTVGHGLQSAPDNHSVSFAQQVKDDVVDGLAEMLDEVDAADAQIAEYSQEQLHSDEVVLTCGVSLSVQKFLLKAAKRGSAKGQRITLIQTETAPNEKHAVHDVVLNGAIRSDLHNTTQEVRLKALVESGIRVVTIADSSVFAIMPRVTKVVLPAQTIFCDGSSISSPGSKGIAQAAKFHKVPVFMLGAIYKLSPLYPFVVEDYVQFGDVGKSLDYREDTLLDDLGSANPLCDIVPGQMIDLIISNIGCHAPSFMGRIASDHYRQADLDFS